MISRFKKFDLYLKAQDGVNQQTILGAILTITTAIIVITLFISELYNFSKIDVVSRMIVDHSIGVEPLKVNFDINFFHASCEEITFLKEVTRGTIHIHEPGNVVKNDIDSGCNLKGEFLTDKVGGNFRFKVNNFVSEEGNKVFRNISHSLKYVKFVPLKGSSAEDKINEINQPLSNLVTYLPENTGLYQYNVKVVPTQYKTLYGDLSFANQYSVTEKIIPGEKLKPTEFISGSRLTDFSGVIFTYDFNPVIVYMEERREKIIDFVSSLFGIIGGVISVFSIFERLLQRSSKAIIGKKD